MARFRAVIEGQSGGHAARLGTAESGIQARVGGWYVGASIIGRVVAGDEEDVFDLYATHGSAGDKKGTPPVHLGTVRLVQGVPILEPPAGGRRG